ncbi:MAG: insulinase family protein [Planctomycetota bacterium]|nr:insulinase family protein [Planctomycetota bacterium]
MKSVSWTKRHSKLLNLDLLHAKGESGVRYTVCIRKGFSTRAAGYAVDFGGGWDNYSLNGTKHRIPAGAAHFLEHVLFKPRGRNIADEISDRGGLANAETGYGSTLYYFSSVNAFRDNTVSLAEMCFPEKVDTDAVAQERGIVLAEHYEGLESPFLAAILELRRALLGDNNASRDLSGTPDEIRAYDAEQLDELRRVFYSPSNVQFVATGDVDPDEFMNAVEERAASAEKLPRAKKNVLLSAHVEAEPVTIQHNVSRPLAVAGWRVRNTGETAAQRRRYKLAVTIGIEALFGDTSDFYSAAIDNGYADDSLSHNVELSKPVGLVWLGTGCERPQRFFDELETARENCEQVLSKSERTLNSIRRRVMGKAVFASSSVRGIRRLLLKPPRGKFPPKETAQDVLFDIGAEEVIRSTADALAKTGWRGCLACRAEGLDSCFFWNSFAFAT